VSFVDSETTRGEIDELDILTKYLFEREYNPRTRHLAPSAFHPRIGKQGLSVFVTSDLSEAEIWNLGERAVAATRAKPLIARADYSEADFVSLSLHVVRDDTPERHADVLGWPEDISAQLEIAQELIARTQVTLRS